MTIPRCSAAISPNKLARHLAMHDAPPTLAGNRLRGVTRYDCENDCIVTGNDAPPVCKHGGRALLAWFNFANGEVEYHPAGEYLNTPEYWTVTAIKEILKAASYGPQPA